MNQLVKIVLALDNLVLNALYEQNINEEIKQKFCYT